MSGLGLLLLALSRNAQASYSGYGTQWPGDTNTPSQDPIFTDSGADMDSKVSAFLALLRKYESDDDYSIIVGGSHFSDFSHHPNILIPLTINGRIVKSTAAGAYQFTFPTWETWRARLSLPDFSPASQDAAALAQIQELGIVDRLANNDFSGTMTRAGRVWASMPGSTANQNPQTLTTALNDYNEILTG